MLIKNSLVKLLMVGTVFASPSLKAGHSQYDPENRIIRVSNKKLENLGLGSIEKATVKIKGHSFSVNGFVNCFTPDLWGAYAAEIIYGSENFTINLSDGGDIPIDPETGLPIEGHPPSPGYDFFNLTFTPTDGATAATTTTVLEVEEVKEKVKPQPSVQKASISLPEQGNPPFFSAFDETTGLYFGMECLTTKKAIDWWKNRLGIDTWFVYGASVQAFDSTPIPDEILQSAQNSQYRLDPWAEVRQMMSTPTEGPRAQDLQSRVQTEYDDLMEGGYHHGTDSKKWSSLSFSGAFDAFRANLEKASETFPVWVAYFSDRELQGHASDILTPDNPAIKISMTAILDRDFYTPLGIYANPIARELDLESGNPDAQISVPLHRQLAGHVQNITPESKHIILRPLPSMAQAMTKAGVTFASFAGYEKESQHGVRLNFTGNFGGYAGTQISYTFTSEDGTAYDLPAWFVNHDFIGGVNDYNNLQHIPFVVTSIQDLTK